MEGMVGEIRWFSGDFAPRNWRFCDGDLLLINENSALYSILGTRYGGDGQTTFALPDFRSRTAIGAGENWILGGISGTENNTMSVNNMPSHNHVFACNNTTDSGSLNNPAQAFMGTGPVSSSTDEPVNMRYASTASGAATMNATSVESVGGNQPINNIQPSLGLNYIICVLGVVPRSS